MSGQNIKVVVRVRPLAANEGDEAVCRTYAAGADAFDRCVTVEGVKDDSESTNFEFARALDAAATQGEVYAATTADLVERVVGGRNATVLAYGQTGSGKTFTVQGGDDEAEGLMPRCVDDVFARVAALGAGREARVTCTYLEIYNEQVRDLFGDDVEKQLQVRTARDGSTLVAGLTEIPLESAQDARDCLAVGAERRQSAATSMNDQSSRSHAVFELKVAVREGGSATTRVGRFLLVDLAGSESAGRTGIEGAGGARRLEAQSINQSLLALGQVITALSGGEKHVPFRDSKLTRLLQDSLGGSAATVLVACVGPSPKSRDESLSTLRYADRAGRIDNVAAHRVHVAPPRAPDAETLAKLERDLAAAERRVADADADRADDARSAARRHLACLCARHAMSVDGTARETVEIG